MRFKNDRAMMLFNAIGNAICRHEKDLKSVGLISLITALRDKEVRKTLGMLVNIARGLVKRI
jgi:uncharacterized protein YjgD (DUF1641 family)